MDKLIVKNNTGTIFSFKIFDKTYRFQHKESQKDLVVETGRSVSEIENNFAYLEARDKYKQLVVVEREVDVPPFLDYGLSDKMDKILETVSRLSEKTEIDPIKQVEVEPNSDEIVGEILKAIRGIQIIGNSTVVSSEEEKLHEKALEQLIAKDKKPQMNFESLGKNKKTDYKDNSDVLDDLI